MAEPTNGEIRMDAANLYREESYTDLKAGTLRKLVPVKPDGTDDPARAPVFSVATQVMTPAGILPLSGEVAGAKTLEEAVAGFPRRSSRRWRICGRKWRPFSGNGRRRSWCQGATLHRPRRTC